MSRSEVESAARVVARRARLLREVVIEVERQEAGALDDIPRAAIYAIAAEVVPVGVMVDVRTPAGGSSQ